MSESPAVAVDPCAAPPRGTPAPRAVDSVSVIIPAFNAAATLPAAIESVLAQTHPAHELIVVDDGGWDDAAGVVRRYGDAVRCVRQDNAGPAAARNHGAAAATGAWLTFLDADDAWLPDKLSEQLAAARHERTQAVFTAVTDCVGLRCEDHVYGGSLLRSDLLPALLEGMPLYGGASSLLIRREAFLRMGGFDPAYPAGEDREFFIRLVDHYGVSYVRRPQVLRRGGPGGFGGDAGRLERNGLKILAAHGGRVADLPRARRVLRRARARLYERVGLNRLERGEFGAAYAALARAAWLWPARTALWKALFNVASGRRRYGRAAAGAREVVA